MQVFFIRSLATFCSLCVNESKFPNIFKQANIISKSQQQNLNQQPLSSWTNTQPFSQTSPMIVLCCEYFSVRCIWLYVVFMSRTNFRVNSHSVVLLNEKEPLARCRGHIWSLSDSNEIWNHNNLAPKRRLNHLAKPAKWLSCVVSTYLCCAFDCMLLSCHVRVSEWIHTL